MQNEKILITLNREIFGEYERAYFKAKPRAKVFPFRKNKTKNKELMYSVLSLNDILPMPKEIYDSLKEKWGDFGVWVAKKYNVSDMQIQNSIMELRVFSETRAQKDTDNIAGGYKLFGDGFAVQSGFFVDDNYNHINPLIICCEYDKENPRFEIRITVTEEKDIYKKIQLHLNNWR